jgi:hypothetical protein
MAGYYVMSILSVLMSLCSECDRGNYMFSSGNMNSNGVFYIICTVHFDNQFYFNPTNALHFLSMISCPYICFGTSCAILMGGR